MLSLLYILHSTCHIEWHCPNLGRPSHFNYLNLDNHSQTCPEFVSLVSLNLVELISQLEPSLWLLWFLYFFPMYLSMSKLFISASSCFLQEYLIHSWPVYNCFCPNNFTKCTSHEWLLLFITFLFFKELITSQITYGMNLFHCRFLLAYLPQLFRYAFCVYDILGHIIIIIPISFGISPVNLPSMWIQWIYLLCGLMWIQFYWSHSFLFSFCPALMSVFFLI